MKRLVEFPLEGTREAILVEVEEDEQSRLANAGALERIQRATCTLEESLSKVRPAAEAVIKKLRDLGDPPHEISVAFGLKLSADAGIVLAASGIEANYTVTIVWQNKPKRKPKIKTVRSRG